MTEPSMNFDKCREIVRGISFIRYLSEDQLTALIKEGRHRFFKKNQPIFIDGTPGDTMYIILFGRVEIFKENKLIAVRESGDYFGEMAMLDSKPRSAGVRALDDTLVLEIGQTMFDRYLGSNPHIIKDFLLTISNRCRVDLEVIDSGFLELYKSEERYRTIVETISDIVLQIDPDGKIAFANSSVSFLGYTPEELHGMPADILLGTDQLETSTRSVFTRRVGLRATSDLEVLFKVKKESPVYEFMKEIPFLLDTHGLWNIRNDLVLQKDHKKEFRELL